MSTTYSDIDVPDAPAIPGLAFRGFRGKEDYPAMVAVSEGSKEVDQLQYTGSIEDVARTYEHLHNCDPYKDMLFVEMNNHVIGYSRVFWVERNDTRIYIHFTYLLPEWRGKGIRRSMLRYNEHRLQEIASDHPEDKPRFFHAWAEETEVHWESLLIHEQYQPVRYNVKMVRPIQEDLPDLPLPEGFKIRPVQPEHYWTIWRAVDEALQDHWEGSGLSDEQLKEWMEGPTFDPGLWVVAWDTNTDQVAGTVLNYIDEKENEKYHRKRGYTEYIAVRRPYRRKGLAKALITRSFNVLKNCDMNEAALRVDTENPTGALQLYETMGFSPVKRVAFYRKPLD